jgi:thioredoxin-dependent peroxiredoxin
LADVASRHTKGAMLKIGDRAKDFTLDSPRGPVSLSDAKGRYAVVYFYPRDNTPGCTREAQGFSKAAKAFAKAGAVVYGISKDSVESHGRFAAQCGLTIDLLSDPDLATHKVYGAYGEKTMYGKKVLGTIRSTFVLDPAGEILRVFPNVKVDGHAEAVLEAILASQDGAPSKGNAKKVPTKKAPAKKAPAKASKR